MNNTEELWDDMTTPSKECDHGVPMTEECRVCVPLTADDWYDEHFKIIAVII